MNVFTFEITQQFHEVYAISTTDANGGYYECRFCHKKCYCVGYGAPDGLLQFQQQLCDSSIK